MDVVDGGAVFDGVQADLVGASDDLAALDAAASEALHRLRRGGY